MIHTVSLIIALVSCAATNLLIKAGVAAIHESGANLSIPATIRAAVCSPWIYAGVVSAIVNLFAYIVALEKFPVSLAFPILVSVSYAIIAGGAAIWFSEKLSVWQWVGVAIVMVGVWVVASGMGKPS